MSTTPSIFTLAAPKGIDWTGPAADAFDLAYDHYRALGFDFDEAMGLADDAVGAWLA